MAAASMDVNRGTGVDAALQQPVRCEQPGLPTVLRFPLAPPGPGDRLPQHRCAASCADLTPCRPTAHCVFQWALFPQDSPDCQTLTVAL